MCFVGGGIVIRDVGCFLNSMDTFVFFEGEYFCVFVDDFVVVQVLGCFNGVVVVLVFVLVFEVVDVGHRGLVGVISYSFIFEFTDSGMGGVAVHGVLVYLMVRCCVQFADCCLCRVRDPDHIQIDGFLC